MMIENLVRQDVSDGVQKESELFLDYHSAIENKRKSWALNRTYLKL